MADLPKWKEHYQIMQAQLSLLPDDLPGEVESVKIHKARMMLSTSSCPQVVMERLEREEFERQRLAQPKRNQEALAHRRKEKMNLEIVVDEFEPVEQVVPVAKAPIKRKRKQKLGQLTSSPPPSVQRLMAQDISTTHAELQAVQAELFPEPLLVEPRAKLTSSKTTKKTTRTSSAMHSKNNSFDSLASNRNSVPQENDVQPVDVKNIFQSLLQPLWQEMREMKQASPQQTQCGSGLSVTEAKVKKKPVKRQKLPRCLFKVSFNGIQRRLYFEGTNFQSLQEQVHLSSLSHTLCFLSISFSFSFSLSCLLRFHSKFDPVTTVELQRKFPIHVIFL